MVQTPLTQASLGRAQTKMPLWRVWLLACRPATLWTSVVPVAVASALAAGQQALHWGVFLSAVAGAVAIQIGTNLFNDWSDFVRGADTVERLGPVRVTQQGLLMPRQILWGCAGAYAFSCVAGLYLVVRGGWPVLAVGFGGILSGLAYTGGPVPLAYVGLGDIFVFFFFGPIATCMTFYLHTGCWNVWVMALGCALGLFACAILAVNNLRDRETDARANKRTLAVRLGTGPAKFQYALVTLTPFAISAAVGLGGPFGTLQLLPLMLLPVAINLIGRVHRSQGRALNSLLGATARLEAVFGTLVIIAVLLR